MSYESVLERALDADYAVYCEMERENCSIPLDREDWEKERRADGSFEPDPMNAQEAIGER